MIILRTQWLFFGVYRTPNFQTHPTYCTLHISNTTPLHYCIHTHTIFKCTYLYIYIYIFIIYTYIVLYIYTYTIYYIYILYMFLYTSTYYIYRHVCVKLGLSIGYINLVFVGCIRWNMMGALWALESLWWIHWGIVVIGKVVANWAHMGVSINGGTPKWLVHNGQSQSNMDDNW